MSLRKVNAIIVHCPLCQWGCQYKEGDDIPDKCPACNGGESRSWNKRESPINEKGFIDISSLQCQDCQDDPECHGTCIESLKKLVFGANE